MGAIILHLSGADKYNSLRARQGDTATRETDKGKKSNVSNETSRDPKAEKQQSSSSRGEGDYSLDAAERRTRTVDTGEGSPTRPVVSCVTSSLMSMGVDTHRKKL